MEAEAITRLTDGVQPPEIRAILVQCLVGELAPSTAVARMLSQKGATIVRAAIDDVTQRAATLSRAGDTLVRDRVDELTQVFVETVAGFADVREDVKTWPESEPKAWDRASRSPGSGDRGEDRISE